ncbi:MAG: carbohydrate kinase family protein [Candidatus Thermoplasmatota archaeon]|nr:carbohydrate kinase family protein [Candidatus Thermoplasmatota archaeon]
MIEKVTVTGHIALDFIFDIPYYPEKNHSIFIKHKEEHFGGGAANIAVGLAKLGCKSELIATVDENFESSHYGLYLKNLGVELNLKKFKGELARAYIFNDEEQNQITYFYWGVSENMKHAGTNARDTVHIAPSHPGFACDMAENAKFLAFEPGQDIPRYKKEQLSFILDNTDILFCNNFELKQIEKILELEKQKLLRQMDVVMTEGEKGSILYSEGNKKRIPAVKANVVDPTGAGDAYKAAFWAGLIRGLDLETSCKLGSIASSLVVKKRGAQSGLPDWDKLLELYEIHFEKAEKI